MSRTSLIVFLAITTSGAAIAGPPKSATYELWNSKEVQIKVASVVLPILAVDEDRCYQKDSRYSSFPLCMKAIWAPITTKADGVIADKSASGDVALVQLLDFLTWEFRYQFEEEVERRGARMIPWLEYLKLHPVCAQEGVCRPAKERVKAYEDIEKAIAQAAK